MPRTRTSRHLAGALAALGLVAFAGTAAQAQTYDVTVTNLTRGQVISPPIVVAHDAGISVFQAGQPASEELAMVAEDAQSAALESALLSEGADVVIAGGPLPPGQSVTLQITPSDGNDRLSALGMLVTTNDAFFAVNGTEISAGTRNAPAYDAGSEANNQDCRFIPGPPCGNEGVRDTDGAEGFVHIHNGIHGVRNGRSGLIAERDDWRNPVARVTISPAAE